MNANTNDPNTTTSLPAPHTNAACPNCGYCPHCGRGQQLGPYQAPYRYWPYPNSLPPSYLGPNTTWQIPMATTVVTGGNRG